jgi:hypothetical protein
MREREGEERELLNQNMLVTTYWIFRSPVEADVWWKAATIAEIENHQITQNKSNLTSKFPLKQLYFHETNSTAVSFRHSIPPKNWQRPTALPLLYYIAQERTKNPSSLTGFMLPSGFQQTQPSLTAIEFSTTPFGHSSFSTWRWCWTMKYSWGQMETTLSRTS